MRGAVQVVAICIAVAACAPDDSASTSTTSTTALAPTGSVEPIATSTSGATTLAPEVGSLLVFGDWGSGTADQTAVASAMARYVAENRLAAVLTTGDNFYSDDAELLLEPLAWVFDRDIPFWITWGNHDVESSSRVEAVEEAFESPPRWTVHEWGEVDVVILDSNQVGSTEQLEFLTGMLEGSENPAVVVFHHPPLSCSSHGDTGTVLDNWVPVFDEDVVMVLSGHDHNYQRFEKSGVSYVVSGGGGNRLYELRACTAGHPERIAGEAVHHFLVLTQSLDEINVDVVDVNGEVIDSFAVGLP